MKKRPPNSLSLVIDGKAMVQCHNGDETYLISRQEADRLAASKSLARMALNILKRLRA